MRHITTAPPQLTAMPHLPSELRLTFPDQILAPKAPFKIPPVSHHLRDDHGAGPTDRPPDRHRGISSQSQTAPTSTSVRNYCMTIADYNRRHRRHPMFHQVQVLKYYCTTVPVPDAQLRYSIVEARVLNPPSLKCVP